MTDGLLIETGSRNLVHRVEEIDGEAAVPCR